MSVRAISRWYGRPARPISNGAARLGARRTPSPGRRSAHAVALGRARGACWPDLDAGWHSRHWSIGARLERILGVHRIGALVPLTPPGWVQAGRHLLAGL